jgi:hypothetical protein
VCRVARINPYISVRISCIKFYPNEMKNVANIDKNSGYVCKSRMTFTALTDGHGFHKKAFFIL